MFYFVYGFSCLSMFISIIIDSFRHVKEIENEYQMNWSFMLRRFLLWLDLKKLTRAEIHEENDARMRSLYFDSINYLLRLIK